MQIIKDTGTHIHVNTNFQLSTFYSIIQPVRITFMLCASKNSYFFLQKDQHGYPTFRKTDSQIKET